MLIWPKNVFWPFWTLGHNLVKNRPIALILVSFDSARRALSNKLSFAYSNFLPQKWAYSPLLFSEFQGPTSRPRSVPEWKFWCHSTQLGELFRISYHVPIWFFYLINSFSFSFPNFRDLYLDPEVCPNENFDVIRLSSGSSLEWHIVCRNRSLFSIPKLYQKYFVILLFISLLPG